MLRAGMVAILWAVTAGAPEDEAVSEPVPIEKAQSEVERLYYQGAAKYSASDYDGAIESFTAALGASTREGAPPEIREALLMNLAKSHVRAHALDDDPMHLKKARDIYQRLVDEAAEGNYSEASVQEARAEIAKLDAEDSPPEPTPTSTPEGPEPDPIEAPPPVSVDKKRRNRGIGLLAGGVAFVGGGAVLVWHGSRFRANAEDQVAMYDDPDDREEEFVYAEVSKGRLSMFLGGAAAAVGLAGVIAGSIDLAKSKRVDARASFGPTGGGLHVRF